MCFKTVCALLGLALHVSASTAADQSHAAVLAEARAAIDQYYSSIRSISVTLEATSTVPGLEQKSYVEWCLDGDRTLMTTYMTPLDDPSGKRTLQFQSQCDGKAYTATFWPVPGFHPSDIVIKPGSLLLPIL